MYHNAIITYPLIIIIIITYHHLSSPIIILRLRRKKYCASGENILGSCWSHLSNYFGVTAGGQDRRRPIPPEAKTAGGQYRQRPRPPEAKTAGGQYRQRGLQIIFENFIKIKDEKKLGALRQGRKAPRFFSFSILMKFSTQYFRLAAPRPRPSPAQI